jgi:hypothetical protein
MSSMGCAIVLGTPFKSAGPADPGGSDDQSLGGLVAAGAGLLEGRSGPPAGTKCPAGGFFALYQSILKPNVPHQE